MNSLEENTAAELNIPEGKLSAGPVASRDEKPWWLAGLVLLIGILVVLAAVAGYLPRAQKRSALLTETRDLALPTVTVVSPAPGKTSVSLALPAEVKPLVESPIYARAAGYLKRWLVDLGATVTAGQLLAEIETPELNQELAQSRAQLAQADAALTLAQTTAARWAAMRKSALVSEQDMEEKQADLALKSATVEAARASVRRLEELLSFARVTAPFAGTITARKIDTGELITAGSARELFRLAQTQTLRVFVRVPQTAARAMTPGLTAELTLPELAGRVFAAKVVRTAGAMAADSRTLLTELEVDNAQGEILSGSFAQVRFADMRADPVLTLPSNTLIFRAEGPQVAVVQAGGKVELRSVTFGRDLGATMEILSGVNPGEQVVLNPADSLVGGVTVRVAEAPKAADNR